MLVYAGIDEAGYGPMFGPLCVASTVFVLHQTNPADGAPHLWKLLNRAVCQKRSDKRRRIVVNDSKKLKGAKGAKSHPLRHLERGVLAFCAAAGERPETDEQLLDALTRESAATSTNSKIVPVWHSGEPIPLPISGTRDEHTITASILKSAMNNAGIEIQQLACEVIAPGQINRASAASERKSSLNLSAALRLAERVRLAHPNAHPRVIIDRQGGRTSYREHLSLAWPEAKIRILSESEKLSRYRLKLESGELTISFEAQSEERHLPVALASMCAKFSRELQMLRFNRFFAGHMPEIKPTAGYVEDGRRFLRDIAPVLQSLDLDRSELVRNI